MAQTYFFNVFKREGFNLKKYHIVPLRIFLFDHMGRGLILYVNEI